MKTWKKNIRKQDRNPGTEYINSKGQIVEEKSLNPP